MKKKILSVFIVLLFLLTSLTTVSAINIKSSKNEKLPEIKPIVENKEDLPDLTINNILNNQENIEKYTINEYDMVIISIDSFASTLQRLIDHKNKHGVKTFFKDVDEIYNEYQGRDEPEKIKYFIKDVHETLGISYVFIVGSMDYVPIRKSAINYYYGINPSKYLPTDLYYADIYNSTGDFCTWDANNNNIFGEFKNSKNIDDAECYADVFIGRIPCFNIEELNIVIDKIIHYENNAYGSEWFKRALILAGTTNFQDCEWIADIIGEDIEKHGFELIKLYTSTNTFTPKIINSETTKGAGIISYMGHGSPKRLMTHKLIYRPLINYTFRLPIYYKNKHLEGMNNGYMLPIVFFGACLTAQPDPISSEYPLLAKLLKIPNKTGFAYNIVKKEGGGAIATIGATRTSAGGIDTGAGFLHYHFFMNYEPGVTVSEMLVKSQYDHLEHTAVTQKSVRWSYEMIENFNLIGDPSLKVGGYP